MREKGYTYAYLAPKGQKGPNYSYLELVALYSPLEPFISGMGTPARPSPKNGLYWLLGPLYGVSSALGSPQPGSEAHPIPLITPYYAYLAPIAKKAPYYAYLAPIGPYLPLEGLKSRVGAPGRVGARNGLYRLLGSLGGPFRPSKAVSKPIGRLKGQNREKRSNYGYLQLINKKRKNLAISVGYRGRILLLFAAFCAIIGLMAKRAKKREIKLARQGSLAIRAIKPKLFNLKEVSDE